MLKSKRKCNFQNVYSAKDVILLFLFETYAIYIYIYIYYFAISQRLGSIKEINGQCNLLLSRCTICLNLFT